MLIATDGKTLRYLSATGLCRTLPVYLGAVGRHFEVVGALHVSVDRSPDRRPKVVVEFDTVGTPPGVVAREFAFRREMVRVVAHDHRQRFLLHYHLL